MKKFFVLTSLLALAACGGGSGGANPETGIRVPDAAIASNKNVTSMASEILVAKNGGSPDIVRSSTIMRDGKEYTAYHLDDAKFFTNETTDEFLSFGIDDNGQINKLVWHEIQEVNGQHVEETEEINRDGPDTNVFTENVQKYKVYANNRWYYTDSLIPREYSKQEIKNAFRRAYNDRDTDFFAEIDAYIDATDMTPINYVHHNVIDLHGKTLPGNHKLRYSDFGYATILANENNQPGDGEGDDSAPIFGGYEVKEIQNTENLHDLTFTGKAVAALGNDHQNGVQKIETNNDATTLVVDANGKQTLTMPFNDYYTIMVEKPRNGDSTISWTGDTTIGYQLDSGQNVENQRVNVNIKYYGDNSVPSEVVGGVKFQNNNVEFNGAFGATAN